MKKKYLLLFILFLIFCTNLLAQESGWDLFGNIKNQKKKLNNLVDICVSPDGKFLYTVSLSNNVKDANFYSIHKWDYEMDPIICTRI